ncbi:hypothetical protein EJ08DRAFT_477452 [Tothia fuscella]|uniref:Uncharacterized protein n=1 Tax=Tothia fuscella TaxID=1048955 RepID=A0A9P4NIR2_9PEZI|nr:hypothetical protein EJ08DRAFT_477452 [Tothia fuscella]
MFQEDFRQRIYPDPYQGRGSTSFSISHRRHQNQQQYEEDEEEDDTFDAFDPPTGVPKYWSESFNAALPPVQLTRPSRMNKFINPATEASSTISFSLDGKTSINQSQGNTKPSFRENMRNIAESIERLQSEDEAARSSSPNLERRATRSYTRVCMPVTEQQDLQTMISASKDESPEHYRERTDNAQ